MPTRRDFLETMAAGLALGPLGLRRSDRGPSTVRNLLFFCIDDLNDWVGFLGGHSGAQTPNMDRLAASGLTFTRAYTASPECMPSRSSLVTGVHTVTHGVQDNLPISQVEALEAVPWLVQWPAHLRAGGWRLFGAGKVYHGGNHEVFGDYATIAPDPLPPGRPLNGIPNAGAFDWGPMDVPLREMRDWRIADWAAGWLSRPQRAPFVLACGFTKPHLPWYVPRAYFDRHPIEGVVLPEVLPTDHDDLPQVARRIASDELHARVVATDNWRRAVQAYLATVTFVDEMLGIVLDALDAGPHAATTAVVLWSDHGWHLGEKLHWRKFALWEEATRIPFVVRVPGLTPPGSVCARTVSALDVYPTLLSLFDLPPVAPLDGHDLTPLLADPAAPWPHPAVTVLGLAHASVRTERWRYIRYDDGSEELYDHDADPLEWTNLAGDPALADVRALLAQHLPVPHPPPPDPTPSDPPPEEPGGERRTFPHPARGVVTLEFLLPVGTTLTLTVLDMSGREVHREALGAFEPGRTRVAWDGGRAGLPSGSYVCRLHGPGYAGTHRVLLLR